MGMRDLYETVKDSARLFLCIFLCNPPTVFELSAMYFNRDLILQVEGRDILKEPTLKGLI